MTKTATALVTAFLCVFCVLLNTSYSQTVKYEEIFDGTTPPSGWMVVDNDNSGSSWVFIQQANFEGGSSVNPQAGVSFWFSSFEDANGSGLIDEWLISPQISGIEAGDSLSFYAGAIDGNFDDSLRVFISTSDNQLASFTNQIAYFKAIGPVGAYTKHTFSLEPFVGEDIFVAVNYYIVDGGINGTHSDNIWVDHFTVFNNQVTSVETDRTIPEAFVLEQNYPNPFNPTTKITFRLAQKSQVSLKVFDVLGQEVATLVEDKDYAAGSHTVEFDGANFSNGVYFYRIESEDFVATRKMTILK